MNVGYIKSFNLSKSGWYIIEFVPSFVEYCVLGPEMVFYNNFMKATRISKL